MAMNMRGSQTLASRARAAPARAVAGSQGIYEDIYEAILDHRLPPGTKLTEDSIGEIFGVSRTVVRKALFRLANENIVRIRPNRGATVASPSVEEAREVFEARRVLEGSIVRKLVDGIDEQGLAALRSLVAEERAAYLSGDRRGWIRLSGAFHLRLAALAGNAVLADMLKELVSRTSLIIALYESPGKSACSFDEHGALIDAIAARDAAAAVRLVDAHLEACEEKLNLEPAAGPVDLASVFTGPGRVGAG